MRFVLPPNFTPKAAGGPATRGGGTAGNFRTPSRKLAPWKRQYIAGLPAFALLGCGCKENLNDGGVLIFVRGRRLHVLCEKCNETTAVERSLTLLEYMGISAEPIPEYPPF